MDSKREYWIKNMVCRRCLKVIQQELEAIKVMVHSLELGKLSVLIDADTDRNFEKQIVNILHQNGFEIAKSEDEMIVENIKLTLIELISELPIDMKKNTSEHLAALLCRDYKILSKIFSKNEHITIEKYFIKLKIEKAKELIQMQQQTFSDISYQLDYSSVNHLSRQFKKITGLSMTDYKNSPIWERNFFDEII